jgi:hypothetical protein
MVSRVIKSVGSSTVKSSIGYKSVTTTKISDMSSKSKCSETDCMVAIDRQFREKGFSKSVRKLLTASWRTRTQKDYFRKFRQFMIWCREKNIDSFTAFLNNCFEFLSDLYNKGLQYRTITDYRSVLSAVLPPEDNTPIGQHPYVIRLFKKYSI